MKCPKCGNEVTQGEVFCGQCGTPVTPPAQPVGPGGAPPPRNGLLRTYSTPLVPGGPQSYSPGPPSQAANTHQHASNPSMPVSAPLPGPNQQTGFYHDATEAMQPVQPNTRAPYSGYLQQDFPASPITRYPGSGQFGSQVGPQTYPFQTGNYNGPAPIQNYPPTTGYNYPPYGTQNGRMPTPPQKQPASPVILLVCITLVVLLIGAVTITTVVLMNRPTANQATMVTPTAAPKLSPTAAPSPTPSPTAAPSPTPSPTVVPTAAPDAGFAWCGTNCSQYGFMTEFPATWPGTPAANSQGVQFTNPTMPEVDAALKAPGATSASATDVLMNDLQTNFAAKPGYAQPTPPPAANATIGGAPWYAVATSYNDDQNQPVHVEVYATVYQGKAYIIELQAPDGSNQFDAVKQQYFVNMLVKYQFLTTAQ